MNRSPVGISAPTSPSGRFLRFFPYRLLEDIILCDGTVQKKHQEATLDGQGCFLVFSQKPQRLSFARSFIQLLMGKKRGLPLMLRNKICVRSQVCFPLVAVALPPLGESLALVLLKMLSSTTIHHEKMLYNALIIYFPLFSQDFCQSQMFYMMAPFTKSNKAF